MKTGPGQATPLSKTDFVHDPGLRRTVLLDVARLTTRYEGPQGPFRPVEEASFRVHPGETLALVGESGCGKTAAALSILRLLPRGGRIESGDVRFQGVELRTLPEDAMRALRGAEIGMVFQEPLAALDPLWTVGDQIGEAVRLDRSLSRRDADARVLELLARVGLPDPPRLAREHPHRLSGGMRQRAMIAIAIARGPSLLVADEPTSALDATVEAGILDLFRRLQAESGMGILLVTHDLAVVAQNAHRAAVMYAGRIVESASVADLLARPRHPYTIALLRSHTSRAVRGERLQPIPGRVPTPSERLPGCRFRDRCPIAKPRCAEVEPALLPLTLPGAGRAVACLFVEVASRL
jgi:oligopeptide/dipeptide ABC transporter ATP-binding protein